MPLSVEEGIGVVDQLRDESIKGIKSFTIESEKNDCDGVTIASDAVQWRLHPLYW